MRRFAFVLLVISLCAGTLVKVPAANAQSVAGTSCGNYKAYRRQDHRCDWRLGHDQRAGCESFFQLTSTLPRCTGLLVGPERHIAQYHQVVCHSGAYGSMIECWPTSPAIGIGNELV